MSTLMPFQLKICRFRIDLPSLQYYLCYKDEICCEQGCCTNKSNDYQLLKTWYFWFGCTFILFMIYRYLLWYCRERKLNQQTNQNNDLSLNVQHFDDASSNLRNTRIVIEKHCDHDGDNEPPPIYSLAINYPKPNELQQAVIPTYEQAISNIHERNSNMTANHV